MPANATPAPISSLRARYESVYGRLLKLLGTPPVSLLDDLEDASGKYAGTREGSSRVSDDITVAEKEQRWEHAAILRKGLERGEAHREAEAAAATLISKTKAPVEVPGSGGAWRSPDGTPPEPLAWTVKTPIWPNKSSVEDALSQVLITQDNEKAMRMTYRTLFSVAWRAMLSDGPPASNEEGWSWRAEATEKVARQIAGALVVRVRDLSPGMVVNNGFGIKTVHALVGSGRSNLARGGGEVKRMDTYRIRYTDGRGDNDVAGADTLVRLPALEKSVYPSGEAD